MEIPKTELFSILQEFNPWWTGQPIMDLPQWRRAAFGPIWQWVQRTDTKRALLLTGPRQTGKTTLYRQIIREMLEGDCPSSNIFYATFDHPLLKLAGLDAALDAWAEFHPPDPGQPQWLFLDEIQLVNNWQIWLKHQVDFHGRRRIALTGSAVPLRDASVESGVGRWETLPLATLSFGEFLRLRQIETPTLARVTSLRELFDWTPGQFLRTAQAARPLTPHFHEYLLRSGFPEPALDEDLTRAQRLLREDIVDKVLKRDLTAQFGVRRVLEIEKLFLYLCYHDGGIVDVSGIAQSLDGVTRQSVTKFLDLFEATHLIYRLKPFGYGKNILRGRDKVYLADAAIPGATQLLGRKLLSQPDRLGAAVETTFFKHVFTRFYGRTPSFSYWLGKRGRSTYEVDIIADVADRTVPFEVKYWDAHVSASDLKGLRLFLEEREVEQGYAITRQWADFGVSPATSARLGHDDRSLSASIATIPAPLACLWLSAS